MIISLGSDEQTELTSALVEALRRRGHELILRGALSGADTPWPSVGRAVGNDVVRGEAETGIVCCWTGTGVSIAANTIPVALEILDAWLSTEPSSDPSDREAIADVENVGAVP